MHYYVKRWLIMRVNMAKKLCCYMFVLFILCICFVSCYESVPISYDPSVIKISEINNNEQNVNVLDCDSDSCIIPCPADMVHVNGKYCPQVEQICLKWDEKVVNVNGKVRCLLFKSPSKCLSKVRTNLDFCIDRFEWPNKEGSIPDVMVSWTDMKKSCENIGKRLCKDFEWEFACEGEDMLPYPYGYERNFTDCNIDKKWIPFDENKLYNPKTRKAEVDRLSQREPSKFVLKCASPFKVMQMCDNVDEFVINSSGQPYKSALKGGHFLSGARNRCRPATLVHNEYFAFY